jgi:hypothetical protein
MDMRVRTPDEYAVALRRLFPRGDYWDRQFADPESDCALFCKAKTEEFIRFRGRMADLQNESAIQTADETIEDWERVITGAATSGLGLDERRALLVSQRNGNVTIGALNEIGQMYGVTITDITFPFRPAFFGFSHFAIDRIAGPAAFSVVFIFANPQPEESVRERFESQITARLLANHIIFFEYGGA